MKTLDGMDLTKSIGNFTFDQLLGHLRTGENFSLSRFGDGEWSAILELPGQNTDGHRYYPDMGLALRLILMEGGRGEMFAMQNQAFNIFKDNETFQDLATLNEWDAQAEIFSANHKRLPELLEVMDGKRVVLVGNRFMSGLPEWGRTRWHVQIPLKNCWDDHVRIYEELKTIIQPGDVVLYCASMMSNVLINWLYRDDITQIDIGSAFDPMVGRFTRKYMKS